MPIASLPPLCKSILCAQPEGDSIVQFAIDQQTGELAPTGNIAEVPTPVSLVFTTGG